MIRLSGQIVFRNLSSNYFLSLFHLRSFFTVWKWQEKFLGLMVKIKWFHFPIKRFLPWQISLFFFFFQRKCWLPRDTVIRKGKKERLVQNEFPCESFFFNCRSKFLGLMTLEMEKRAFKKPLKSLLMSVLIPS